MTNSDPTRISDDQHNNAPAVPDVDALAQFIRQIDGNHTLGACALSERICEWLAATPAPAPAQDVGLIARQFDLICQAIDKADTITMEGDYMLDSDDCISVVRVMQALFDIAALRAKGGK